MINTCLYCSMQYTKNLALSLNSSFFPLGIILPRIPRVLVYVFSLLTISLGLRFLHTYLEHIKTSKGRYGSRYGVGGNERHDGNHSKTSIVDFTGSLAVHKSIAHTGEVDSRENHGWELSSLCVVFALGFADPFGDEDSGQDLGLAFGRNKGPSVERLDSGK